MGRTRRAPSAPRARAKAAARSLSPDPRELLDALRSDLHAVADPDRARAMQRYMRSTMPFHGVPAPAVLGVCRTRFEGISFRSASDWSRTVRFLWRHAKFREERYATIVLTGARPAREFQTPAVLPIYEEMIRTGAWWDYVDEVAVRRLGPILRRFPGPMAAQMRSWSGSEDLWTRRSSIICQVGAGDATDRALLFDCLEPSLGRREFFLRKAIGWALRQYARVEPSVVADYVSRNAARLSPLSRKEALRRILL